MSPSHPAPPTAINSWPVLAFAADLSAMLSPSTGWTGHVLCRMSKDVFVTWQVSLVDHAHPDELEILRWHASSGHYFEQGVNARSVRDALDQAYADFMKRTAPPSFDITQRCPACGMDVDAFPPCEHEAPSVADLPLPTHDTDLAKGMVTP